MKRLVPCLALLACGVFSLPGMAQSAAGCEFSRFAQGRVIDFGVINGNSVGINTNLPMNGVCAAQARVEIQSVGGAFPQLFNAEQNMALPYQVESLTLTRDGSRSAVLLLLGIEGRDYTDIPAGVYEHHLILTLTP